MGEGGKKIVSNKANTLRLYRHIPLLVLAISLSFTFLLWRNAHFQSIASKQIEFDSLKSAIADRIVRHLKYYEQVLYSVRAFYTNQHEMERGEFAGYIVSLEYEKNFPGLQGVSFSPFILHADKPAYIKKMRQTDFAGYAIRPDGSRPSYAPVTYIEPANERNTRVLGFDNLSEPTRRALVEQVRDEDRVLASEKLRLMQNGNNDEQQGFLMFLPVYKRGAVHETIEERRTRIEGWFAAAFRANELVAAILDSTFSGLNVELYDGGEISSQSRMYGIASQGRPLYQGIDSIDIAGRKWLMRVSSTETFEAGRNRSSEMAVAAGGSLLSFLLFLVAWLVIRHQEREQFLNTSLSKELNRREQAEKHALGLGLLQEAILNQSPAGIALYLKSGACVLANEAYAKALGSTAEALLQQGYLKNELWQQNELLALVEQVFENDHPISRDIAVVTTSGNNVILECVFAPIDISGTPHLLVIINDISERAAIEGALFESMRMLEEKEREKSRFLAAAGHDLRQPLAAANMFIETLKLSDPSSQQSKIIQKLDQSMNIFGGLLDSLLNIAKLDAGVIKPEFSPIYLPNLFSYLEENFGQVCAEKKINFRLYCPMKEELFVRCDTGLLN